MSSSRLNTFFLCQQLAFIMCVLAETSINQQTVIEVCSDIDGSLSCPAGNVLMIDQAFRGRMKASRCIRYSKEHIGCKADVQLNVERLCAGRQQCVISQRDQVLLPHGCESLLVYYMEIKYRCLAVFNIPSASCERNGGPFELTAESGYLASDVMARGGQGSRQCPWLIRGSFGQAINVTLFDFGLSQNHTVDHVVCVVYAELKIGDILTHMCGRRTRIQSIYKENVAQDFTLVINDLSTVPDSAYFLLHFEVHRPTTCSDYNPPPNAIVTKVIGNDTVVVRCVADDGGRRAWNMSCRNGQWVGTAAYCEKPVSSTTVLSDTTSTAATSSALIVAVVLLGLLLIIIPLLGFCCYIRRKSTAPVDDGQPVPYHYGHFIGQGGGNNLTHAQSVVMDPSYMGYQSRSQKDLLDCCNNAPTPQQLRQHRDYATTLEMRRLGNPQLMMQYGPPGQPGVWPQQQVCRTPDVWTTPDCADCPVHRQYGQYTPGTWGTSRRRPVQHIYDLPMGAEYDEGDGCFNGTGTSHWHGHMGTVPRGAVNAPGNPWNAAGAAVVCAADNVAEPTSPFYNELEPFSNVGSNTCILPVEDRQPENAGGNASVAAWGNDRRQQQMPPPIPLTKL